mmetsp:Transcript_6632/g.20674  ORF Transcript_6632/g.20674 Transcript_6632/m.20674 type:complete len:111 (+) Transcript_6632:407-739(+)
MCGAPAPATPKQFSAGQAEMYCRFTSQERYEGEVLLDLQNMTPFYRRSKPYANANKIRDRSSLALDARTMGGQAGVATLEPIDLTVDIIASTHRVWLGTGGFAEKPEELY